MTEDALTASAARAGAAAVAAAATPGRLALGDTDIMSGSPKALKGQAVTGTSTGGNAATRRPSGTSSLSNSPLHVPVPATASDVPPSPAPESEADDVGMPIEVDDCVRSSPDESDEHSNQPAHQSPPMTALSIMRRERERSIEDYPLDNFVGSCDEADSATTPNPPSVASSQISQHGQSRHKQQDQHGGKAASDVGGRESSVTGAAQDGINHSDVRPPMTHSTSVGSVGSTSSAVLGALGVLDRSSSRHNAKGGGGGTGAGAAANQGGGSSSAKARRSSRKVLDRPRSSSWASFDDYGGYSSGERSTGSGHGCVRKKKEKKHAKERERKERVVESYHQHYGGTGVSTATSTKIVSGTSTSATTNRHPPAPPVQQHSSAYPPVSHIQRPPPPPLQQQLIVDPTDDAAGRPTPPPPPPHPSQLQPHAQQQEQQDHARYQQRQQYQYQQQHNQSRASSTCSPRLSSSAQQSGQYFLHQQYQQHPPYHLHDLDMAPPIGAGHHLPGHAASPAPHYPDSVSRPRSRGNESSRRRLEEARHSSTDISRDDDSDSDEGGRVYSRRTSPTVRTKTPPSMTSTTSSRKHDSRRQQCQSQAIGRWPPNRHPQQSYPVERGYPHGFTNSSYIHYSQQQQEGPHGELILPPPTQYGAEGDGSSPTYYSDEKEEKRAVEVARYGNSDHLAANVFGPISQTYTYGSHRQRETGILSNRCSSVSFSTIEIRSYERILGDNPSCSHGPAVSIGWQYEPDPITVRVDEFEYYRSGDRLDGTALVLSRCEREEILEELGYTRSAIADAVRTNVKVKNNRRQTVHNLAVARLEEAAESAKRKLKRVLLGRKKDKRYTLAPPTSPIRSGDEKVTRKSSLRAANFVVSAAPALAPASSPGPVIPPNEMQPPHMVTCPVPPLLLRSSHPPVQYQICENSTGTAGHLKKMPVIVSEDNSLPLEALGGTSSQGYSIGTGSMAYDPQYQYG